MALLISDFPFKTVSLEYQYCEFFLKNESNFFFFDNIMKIGRFFEVFCFENCDTMLNYTANISDNLITDAAQVISGDGLQDLPDSWENSRAMYHTSIPLTKLYYPEPFVAAPSFLHYDFWFIHISVYVYWIWFLFSFIIVFFVITGLCTIRWCNPRMKPRRETRGISRSKCGDLITAIVPVTWATSIIIHESTDAVDMFDGGGTTNISVGIRAYQWGWEYYYPRSLDLHRKTNPYAGLFLGRTIVNSPYCGADGMRRKHINKSINRFDDSINISPHLLILPSKINSIPFLSKLNHTGRNVKAEHVAFRSVYQYNRFLVSELFNPLFIAESNLNTELLFPNDLINNGSYEMQTRRPHQYNSSLSIINNNNTFSDTRAFISYVRLIRSNSHLLDVDNVNLRSLYNWQVSYFNQFSKLISQTQISTLEALLSKTPNTITKYLDSFIACPSYWLNANFFFNKKILINFVSKLPTTLTASSINDLRTKTSTTTSSLHFKKFNPFKLKISKVVEGTAKATQEKSIRLQVPQTLNHTHLRRSKTANSLVEKLNECVQKSIVVPSLYGTNVSTNWLKTSSLQIASSFKFRNVNLPTPIYSNNPWHDIRNYDILANSVRLRPRIFNSRDELIPESALNFTYNILEGSEITQWKFSNSLKYFNNIARHYFPKHFVYFELDNVRAGRLQQISDMYWDLFCFNLGVDYIADMRVFKYIITQNEGSRAVYWAKMHKISRKYFKLFNKNADYFSDTSNNELIKLFIRRIKKRMLLTWRPNHQLNTERHLLKFQRKKAIPVEFDEGFTNLVLLPKVLFSQFVINTSALNLLEDSYTAWKAFSSSSTNNNFNVLSSNLISPRSQTLLSWLESFTLEYEPTTLLSNIISYNNNKSWNSKLGFIDYRLFTANSAILFLQPLNLKCQKIYFWFPEIWYLSLLFFFDTITFYSQLCYFCKYSIESVSLLIFFSNRQLVLAFNIYDCVFANYIFWIKSTFYIRAILRAFLLSYRSSLSLSNMTWQVFISQYGILSLCVAPSHILISDGLQFLSEPSKWYSWYTGREETYRAPGFFSLYPDIFIKNFSPTIVFISINVARCITLWFWGWWFLSCDYLIKKIAIVVYVDLTRRLNFYTPFPEKLCDYWFDLLEATLLFCSLNKSINSICHSWISLNILNLLNLSEFTHNHSSFIFSDVNEISIALAAPLKYLTATANSITGYEAVQKIYRTRYDEHRSNARVEDFSMAAMSLYRLSTEKLNYNTYLSKSSNKYFNTSLIKSSSHKILNEFYPLYSMTNTYTYDFPFALAIKSDPARYIWIDWWLNWGLRDIQPASFSRYGLYGMPVFTKLFEYSAPENEMYADIENYLTRVARVRRLTLAAWVSSPYFSARANHWYTDYSLVKTVSEAKYRVNVLNKALNSVKLSWNSLDLNRNSSKGKLPLFFPANSLAWAPSRSSWRMVGFMESYYYYGSKLADILTKREYLFREFLLRKGKLIRIPENYIASPKHFSFSDLRNGLVAADSSFRELDAVRHTNPHLPVVFEYFVLKSYYNHIASYLPFPTLTKLLINLMAVEDQPLHLDGRFDDLLYKRSRVQRSQYRALRRGSSNMIRLHATASMAMPVHTRVHLFASSRDVIHSWAIPSAGIKIDCIPGFSSHRIVYFAVHGIFWGQCMEVCGRYHHWMPIVVYFMRRDLFILWCTHFIFLKAKLNFSEIYDHHQNDFIRSVTHQPDSWLVEVVK